MDDEGDASPVSRPRDAAERSRILGHLVVLSINVYASVRNVLTKQALDIGANVGALAFVYTACRALVLSLVARRVDGTVRLDPAHAVQFLWIGIASCGNVLGALLALRYFTAMAYAAMNVFLRVFVKYDSFGLGLEQISRRNVIRILISMWGAAVLVVLAAGATDWAASGSDGPATAAAAAMDTLAVEEGRGWGWIASLTVWRYMSMSILHALECSMHEEYPETTLDSWIFTAGSVVTLVVGVVCGMRPVDFLLKGQSEPWIAIMHGVLFVTVYTPKAVDWAVHFVSPGTFMQYMLMRPVMTLILAIAFLSTPSTLYAIFGVQVIGLVVMVAVFVMCPMEHQGRPRGRNRP